MSSIILRTATRFLMTLLLLFSIFLLLRGHNEPGGGFVGGLVAAAAFILYAIAYDVGAVRSAMRIGPQSLIGIGLLLAGGSGIVPLFAGRPFLTGEWLAIDMPGVLQVYLGTPLFFDIGVYLAVLGVTLLIVLTLTEE